MNEKGLQQLDDFLLNCENITQDEREAIMKATMGDNYLTYEQEDLILEEGLEQNREKKNY